MILPRTISIHFLITYGTGAPISNTTSFLSLSFKKQIIILSIVLARFKSRLLGPNYTRDKIKFSHYLTLFEFWRILLASRYNLLLDEKGKTASYSRLEKIHFLVDSTS